ncbi:hypothetical protein, partial [Pantoea sp. ANP04]|uniref:hypothetical protein n=1 Tax=Pantoea sp. ANP04 TaxID=3064896 RepID=UPI0035C5C256
GYYLSMPSETQTNISAADLLDELNQVAMGFVWQNPTTDDVVGISRWTIANTLLTTPTNSFSASHSTAVTHFCISDIQFTNNLDDGFNSYVVSSTIAPNTVLASLNQDSVDQYGELRFKQQVHLDSASLSTWASMLPLKDPTRRVKSVSTRAIRAEGQMVNMNALLPGNAVNVTLS